MLPVTVLLLMSGAAAECTPPPYYARVVGYGAVFERQRAVVLDPAARLPIVAPAGGLPDIVLRRMLAVPRS